MENDEKILQKLDKLEESFQKKDKKTQKLEEIQEISQKKEERKKQNKEKREELQYISMSDTDIDEDVQEYAEKLEYFEKLFREHGHKINIYRYEGKKKKLFIDDFETDGQHGLSDFALELPVTKCDTYIFQHQDRITGTFLKQIIVRYDKDYVIKKHNERYNMAFNFNNSNNTPPPWFNPFMMGFQQPQMNQDIPSWLQENKSFQNQMVQKMFGNNNNTNNEQLLEFMFKMQEENRKLQQESEKRFYDMQIMMLQQQLNNKPNDNNNDIYKLMINQSNASSQQILGLVGTLIKNSTGGNSISETAQTMLTLKDLFDNMSGNKQDDSILGQVMPAVSDVIKLYSTQQAMKLQENQHQQQQLSQQQSLPQPEENMYTEAEVEQMMNMYKEQLNQNVNNLLEQQQIQQQQQQQQPTTMAEEEEMYRLDLYKAINDKEFIDGLFGSISYPQDEDNDYEIVDYLIEQSEKKEYVNSVIEFILGSNAKTIISILSAEAAERGISLTEEFVNEVKKQLLEASESEDDESNNNNNEKVESLQ